jgi:hypothetical protein
MSDAQAIPDNLYYYSDQTTQANSALQTWIRTTLAPAVDLYRETAIDLGDSIPDLTLPASGSIDVDAQTCLGQTFNTDKHVHVVGQAFQEAGDTGTARVQMPGWMHNHPDPGGDPTQYGIITTPNSTVDGNVTQIDDAQRQKSERQGQQLAKYILANGVNDYVLQQLKIHQNDPYYMAALFNSMTPAELQDFLSHFTHDSNTKDGDLLTASLIAAFDSGALSKSSENSIANWLLDTTDTDQMGLTIEFLAKIQADPMASRNFVESLTDNQFTEFANGLYFYMGEPGNTADLYASSFLDVCASALMAMNNKAEMKSFMDRVDRIFTNTRPSDMNDMMNALTHLLQNFETQYFSDPPIYKNTPSESKSAQLDAWINQQAGLMAGYVSDFGQWIFNTDSANSNEAAFQRGFLENIIISTALALIPVDLPLLGTAALAMGEAAITSWLQPQIDSVLQNWMKQPGTDVAQKQQNAFLKAQEAYAKFELALQLFGEGQLVIWQNGQEVPITLESTGCSSDDQLLTWILKNDAEVTLAGTDGQTTLGSLLGQAGNQFSSNSQN